MTSQSVLLDTDTDLYAKNIPLWAIQDPRMTHRDFRVLCAFMTFAGLNDIYPSYEQIGIRSGISARSAKQSTGNLINLGYLRKIARYDDKGGQLSNGYVIRLRHEYHASAIESAQGDKKEGGPKTTPRQGKEGGPKTTPKKKEVKKEQINASVTSSEPIEEKAHPFDEQSTASWDSLKPAWEKALPIVCEYYGMSETTALAKVLACYFTREYRHIKKGSEWQEYAIDTAFTIDELIALLRHWRDTLPAMPRKPLTIQAQIDTWRNNKGKNDQQSGFQELY